MTHFVCSTNGENLLQIKLQIKSLNVNISTRVQVFFEMLYYFTDKFELNNVRFKPESSLFTFDKEQMAQNRSMWITSVTSK